LLLLPEAVEEITPSAIVILVPATNDALALGVVKYKLEPSVTLLVVPDPITTTLPLLSLEKIILSARLTTGSPTKPLAAPGTCPAVNDRFN